MHLLKQLQLAVNKSTATISQLAKPEDPTLISLGGRQGQLRTLLDQLVQKSSEGKLALGPENDPSDKVPEEAEAGKADAQELQHMLLDADAEPDADQMKQNLDMMGHRMVRSKQRLALDKDPGDTTQEIQKRILQNMDDLIQMGAKPQEQVQRQQQQQQQGQQQGQQRGQQGAGSGRPSAGQRPAAGSTAQQQYE